jgi:hypothetical protein
MARPPKEPKDILVDVPCKVLPSVAEEITSIAISEKRSKSQVTRLLVDRALKLYRKDGQLNVYDDEIEGAGERQAIIHGWNSGN